MNDEGRVNPEYEEFYLHEILVLKACKAEGPSVLIFYASP